MIDLSVIIVSYRTPEHLRRCLQALSDHPGGLRREIIVVDNDSGDESPQVAASFPGVIVVETGANLGFAGGVNRGLARAAGRYLMIMNPDVEVGPDSLDVLAAFLRDHPEVGIAAPKLLNTDGTLQYSCRRHYTLKTVLLRRTVLGKVFPNAPDLRRHLMLDYDHRETRPVDWVAGAAMMVRREALEDTGPMDERYFLYFEDVDWCTRMQARGWLVQYVPQSVVTHHWQRASRGVGPAARRHIRSGLRFYDRWGGLVYLWRQRRDGLRTAALLLWDLAAVAAAFGLAYLLRQQLAFFLHKPLWPFLAYKGFFAANLLVYAGAIGSQGLYRQVKEGDWVDVAFRVIRASTLGALILMASTFILDIRGYSRLIVLSSWPLIVAGVFLGRRVLHRVFTRAQRDRWNLRRVALVGESPLLDRIEQGMTEAPELGWEPVRLRRTPWLGRPDGEAILIKQLRGERVSDVVLTPELMTETGADLSTSLTPLRQAGFGVRLVSPFLNSLPAQARVEMVGDLRWLSMENPALKPAQWSKRAVDLTVAGAMLVFGAVPAAGAALAGGVSRGRILEPKESLVGRWGEAFSLRRLAAGGWLKDYPALWQVLRGRLSLVGPRPLRPGESTPGGSAWGRVRERHRPGLVGPWCLHRVHSLNEEMLQELRYLEEWSPEADLKLLARLALKRGRGGPGGGSAPADVPKRSRDDAATAGWTGGSHSMGVGS